METETGISLWVLSWMHAWIQGLPCLLAIGQQGAHQHKLADLPLQGRVHQLLVPLHRQLCSGCMTAVAQRLQPGRLLLIIKLRNKFW